MASRRHGGVYLLRKCPRMRTARRLAKELKDFFFVSAEITIVSSMESRIVNKLTNETNYFKIRGNGKVKLSSFDTKSNSRFIIYY